jgi:rhodanese-related sulfurtransferase
MTTKNTLISAITLACSMTIATAWADDNNGNRYFKDRQYNSEISAAETYLDMMQNKVTVIDVRRLREYAAGHPERAYNVPYPHIINSRDQNAATFYWEVYNVVHGNVDTPIATLCRTGSRSVDAANILADPQNTAGDPSRDAIPDAIPFTNVRNIWEGFVGQHKYAYSGSDVAHDENGDHIMLNLANTETFPLADEGDVYEHTKDANPNKDGWRNFMNLPWSTHIQKPLAYQQNKEQYECWQTDEGC